MFAMFSTGMKKKGIKFIEIPDHIILELAMLEGRISRVSGILSSLLFYSAAIGIPTISYINDFGSLNQAAKSGQMMLCLVPITRVIYIFINERVYRLLHVSKISCQFSAS